MTCSPAVVDGACKHVLDNGGCVLPDQFMCPFFLAHRELNPEEAPGVPKDVLDRVRTQKPIKIKI